MQTNLITNNPFLRSFFAFTLLGIVIATAQTSPAKELREHYLALARKIYTWEDDSESQKRSHLDQLGETEIVGRLHKMVSNELLNKVRSTTSSASLLQEISSIQAISLFTWGGSDVTNTPFAVDFDLDGNHVYSVAYGIVSGSSAIPNSENILEFYYLRNGKVELVQASPDNFRNRTFFVYRLPHQQSGDARLLVWGTRIADTAARLNVTLYSFNGRELNTLWERTDLRRGTIEIEDGSILLGYDPYQNPPETERVRSRFYFTPSGLQ